MNVLVIVILLILLLGGGASFHGYNNWGHGIGGGISLGTILLICLIVWLFGNR